jgi:hypothetical protein
MPYDEFNALPARKIGLLDDTYLPSATVLATADSLG